MKIFKLFFTVFIILLCLIFCFYIHKKDNEKVVIKYSSWGSKSETDVIKSVISDFEEENSNIKINFIHIPQNYFQKIHLLFASGLESDVVFFNNQNILMYINAGLLEDLTPYFYNIENEFFPEAVNCFKKDNKIYAVPRDISNLVIYYNKEIFQKQNIKIPQKIKDINELRKLAKKLTSKENFGINFEENSLFWLYYLSSNNGGVISDDGKNIIIGEKESIEALNLYADMINQDKSIPAKEQMGSMTSAQMFINGKLAMYLSGRWMTPKFRELIKFDWDVIEFPAPNKVYIDASGWAVSKKSKHKKEAIAFIKKLSSPFASCQFAKSGLIVPANKLSCFQEDGEKPFNYLAFKDMIKNSKPTTVNENYAKINDILTEKTENIFNGKKRAEEVFDTKTISELRELLD